MTRTTDSSNRFSQSLRVRASEVLLYIHCCNFVFVVFFYFRTMSYLIHCYYFLPQANIVPDTQLQFIFCFRTISYLIHSYNSFFASGQYRTWYTVTIYFLFQANIVPDTQLQFFFCFRPISHLIQLQLFVFASGQYNLTWYTVTIYFYSSGQYSRTWYTIIFCKDTERRWRYVAGCTSKIIYLYTELIAVVNLYLTLFSLPDLKSHVSYYNHLVLLSVCHSSVSFLHFNLLLQNCLTKLNQTWQGRSLGTGDWDLFKCRWSFVAVREPKRGNLSKSFFFKSFQEPAIFVVQHHYEDLNLFKWRAQSTEGPKLSKVE